VKGMIIMRVRETKYNNESALIIYVSEEEHNTEEVKNKIESYKSKYKNIAVFIGGKGSLEEAIKKIIQDYDDEEEY
jgi:hypothetical protein